MRNLLLVLLTLTLIGFSLDANARTSRESIAFLDPNGTDLVTYGAVAYQGGSYTVNFRKQKGATAKDYLADFLYINPTNYRFSNSNPQFGQFVFPGGKYSSITRGDISSSVTLLEDGTRRYETCPGDCVKLSNGHFGIWNSPDNFKRIVQAWVFPSNLEIVAYSANRKGTWALRHNTLTYYGQEINDVTFKIDFRSKSIGTLNQIREDLSGEDVEVLEAEDGVRVALSETVLFSSGSAELYESGEAVLGKLAQLIKDKDHPVIIEGHTDNVPIKGALSNTHASNWELSAARSLAVLRFLSGVGIAENRLQSHAFGEHRPRAENSSPEGRARNRRIEVLIPLE